MRRAFRPRVLLYAGILALIVVAAGVMLWQRAPVKVDVIRDRAAMAADTGDGVVENVYRLQIMNTDETRRRFRISASGLPGLELTTRDNPVELTGASSRMVPVRIKAKPDDATHGSVAIEFKVEGLPANDPDATPVVIVERSRFLVP